MGGAFLNYRDGDESGGGRLIDRLLVDRFGADLVFRDSGAAPVPVWRPVLRDCSLLVVVIGPHWVAALDNPHDHVRQQLAESLYRTIPVLPVLLDGARAPRLSDLPDEVGGLLRHQQVEVRRRFVEHDLERVLTLAQRWLPAPPVLPPPPAPRIEYFGGAFAVGNYSTAVAYQTQLG